MRATQEKATAESQDKALPAVSPFTRRRLLGIGRKCSSDSDSHHNDENLLSNKQRSTSLPIFHQLSEGPPPTQQEPVQRRATLVSWMRPSKKDHTRSLSSVASANQKSPRGSSSVASFKSSKSLSSGLRKLMPSSKERQHEKRESLRQQRRAQFMKDEELSVKAKEDQNRKYSSENKITATPPPGHNKAEKDDRDISSQKSGKRETKPLILPAKKKSQKGHDAKSTTSKRSSASKSSSTKGTSDNSWSTQSVNSRQRDSQKSRSGHLASPQTNRALKATISATGTKDNGKFPRCAVPTSSSLSRQDAAPTILPKASTCEDHIKHDQGEVVVKSPIEKVKHQRKQSKKNISSDSIKLSPLKVQEGSTPCEDSAQCISSDKKVGKGLSQFELWMQAIDLLECKSANKDGVSSTVDAQKASTLGDDTQMPDVGDVISSAPVESDEGKELEEPTIEQQTPQSKQEQEPSSTNETLDEENSQIFSDDEQEASEGSQEASGQNSSSIAKQGKSQFDLWMQTIELLEKKSAHNNEEIVSEAEVEMEENEQKISAVNMQPLQEHEQSQQRPSPVAGVCKGNSELLSDEQEVVEEPNEAPAQNDSSGVGNGEGKSQFDLWMEAIARLESPATHDDGSSIPAKNNGNHVTPPMVATSKTSRRDSARAPPTTRPARKRQGRRPKKQQQIVDMGSFELRSANDKTGSDDSHYGGSDESHCGSYDSPDSDDSQNGFDGSDDESEKTPLISNTTSPPKPRPKPRQAKPPKEKSFLESFLGKQENQIPPPHIDDIDNNTHIADSSSDGCQSDDSDAAHDGMEETSSADSSGSENSEYSGGDDSGGGDSSSSPSSDGSSGTEEPSTSDMALVSPSLPKQLPSTMPKIGLPVPIGLISDSDEEDSQEGTFEEWEEDYSNSENMEKDEEGEEDQQVPALDVPRQQVGGDNAVNIVCPSPPVCMAPEPRPTQNDLDVNRNLQKAALLLQKWWRTFSRKLDARDGANDAYLHRPAAASRVQQPASPMERAQENRISKLVETSQLAPIQNNCHTLSKRAEMAQEKLETRVDDSLRRVKTSWAQLTFHERFSVQQKRSFLSLVDELKCYQRERVHLWRARCLHNEKALAVKVLQSWWRMIYAIQQQEPLNRRKKVNAGAYLRCATGDDKFLPVIMLQAWWRMVVAHRNYRKLSLVANALPPRTKEFMLLRVQGPNLWGSRVRAYLRDTNS